MNGHLFNNAMKCKNCFFLADEEQKRKKESVHIIKMLVYRENIPVGD
jgi:hypothetical protein